MKKIMIPNAVHFERLMTSHSIFFHQGLNPGEAVGKIKTMMASYEKPAEAKA